MIGWIKLHRSIDEWGWKRDPNVMALWIHLLINANLECAFFLGHKIERGSLATGLNSLSDKTGLSISQVRTCLDKLKKTGEIAIKTTQKFSIISITKFDEFQDNRTQNDTPLSTQNSTPVSTPIATNKEVKKKEVRSKNLYGDFVEEDSGKHKKKKGTRISDDWVLKKSLGEWALEQGLKYQEVKLQADRFLDYWKAVSGEKGVKVDWDATFRNWIRSYIEKKEQQTQSAKKISPYPDSEREKVTMDVFDELCKAGDF